MRTIAPKGRTRITSAVSRVSGVRGVRMGVQLALVALAASCTDNLTAPSGSDSTTGTKWTIAPEIESAVLHRTIEMDGVSGSASARIVQKQTVVQQIRELPHGQAIPTTQPGSQPWTSGPAGAPKVPMPVTSLPAQLRRTACGNEPTWSRTLPLASLPGAVLVATGSGDAPATRIQVVQNGKTIATVTRSWIRMARSWELTRQETTMPARNYRDVIAVERRAPVGGALRTPLPVFSCIAEDSSTRSRADVAIDPFGMHSAKPTTAGILAPQAPRAITACEADGYGDECAPKRDELRAAEIELGGAIAVAAVACTFPQPFQAVTCVGALAAYSKALAHYYVQERALSRCLAEQAAKRKACACAGGQGMESRSAEPASLVARMSGHLSPVTAAPYEDCSNYSPFAGLGPEGTMNFTLPPITPVPESVRLCVFQIDIDFDTGVVEVFVLYCYTVYME